MTWHAELSRAHQQGSPDHARDHRKPAWQTNLFLSAAPVHRRLALPRILCGTRAPDHQRSRGGCHNDLDALPANEISRSVSNAVELIERSEGRHASPQSGRRPNAKFYAAVG